MYISPLFSNFPTWSLSQTLLLYFFLYPKTFYINCLFTKERFVLIRNIKHEKGYIFDWTSLANKYKSDFKYSSLYICYQPTEQL